MELPDSDRERPEAQLPFLNVHRYLSRAAFPVPQVYRSQVADGLIALEDLGDETLERVVLEARSSGDVDRTRALYRRAMGLIIQLQKTGRLSPDPECLAFGRRFDYQLLRWELDHFREWLLEAGRGVRLNDTERSVLDDSFDRLARTLDESPQVLVHRDFQSRNLMVETADGRDAIRVIDFQDALLGPPVYDLVALLRDSYLELDAGLVDELVTEFIELSNYNVIYITNLFRQQTVQRKLKDAGRFVFMERMRGMPDFLPAIGPSLRYVRDALEDLPDYDVLRELLARHLPEFR